MKIWIDADACPYDIKEIAFRAAERLQIPAVLVANAAMRHPASAFISRVQVPGGMDEADAYIVEHAMPGELAITADIPLAALLVPRGVIAIDPRGELYSEANIGERLAMRNLMQELRGAGMVSGGPKPFSKQDKQSFASTFDRELTRGLRQEQEQARAREKAQQQAQAQVQAQVEAPQWKTEPEPLEPA